MNNLELHYYLNDDKHSMDAYVKNRAEHELLKLVSEVASILNIDVLIEIEAMEEGGIKEVIKFFSKNKNKAYLGIFVFFATILGNVVTNVTSQAISSDTELDSLTKEEKRLNIIKLKQEIESNKGLDSSVTLKKIVDTLNDDFKVKVFKSRFYSQIIKETNIYKFSLTELNNTKIHKSQYSIDRHQFKDQILNDENTAIVIVENANIEVLAPVLKSSDMKWRGIYNGKTITFDLKDNSFKNAVLNKQYSFTSGTSINCKLTYKEGINENGDLCLKEISVHDVLKVYEGNTIIETDKYKKQKLLENQMQFQFK